MNYRSESPFYRFFQILTLATLIIPVSASFIEAKEKYPWTLKPIYEIKTHKNVIPIDLEGDGIDEILEGIAYCYQIRNLDGIIYRQMNFDTAIVYAIGAFDLDNDNEKEIVFSETYDDEVFIQTFGSAGQKKMLAYKGQDIRIATDQKYDSRFLCGAAHDLNNDGCNDLIMTVHTGFDLYPRGIFAYDYKNNRELWHYWTAGTMNDIVPPILYDINGDTKKEIIFGTSAPCNGAILDGIDDRSSWIYVLDNNGKLIWKKQVGKMSTRALVWVGKINNDTTIDLIVCETDGLASIKEPNRLEVLNAKDGSVQTYICVGEKFLGMSVCDYDRDDRLEIITGNSDGKLRVFNDKLELIAVKEFDLSIKVIDVKDLDGDGHIEILISTNDGRLVILNEALKVLCDYRTFHGRLYNERLVKVRNRYNIICSVPISSSESLFSIFKIEKLSVSPVIPFQFFLSTASLLAVVGLILMFVSHRRYVKIIRRLVDESLFGVILLNNQNKLIYYNLRARKTIGESKGEILDFIATKEIKELLTSNDRTKDLEFYFKEKKLSISYRRIAKRKLLMLYDKTSEDILAGITEWSLFAQRLAHEIKNPLSTINLTLQRIQSICREKLGKSSRNIDKYTSSALEEVARLRETVDKFMRILSLDKPTIIPVNINELLDRILNKHQLKKPREIRVQKFYTLDLPVIYCDENQITAAFSNIIENAFEAMKGKGVLTVYTNITEIINPWINPVESSQKPNDNLLTMGNNQISKENNYSSELSCSVKAEEGNYIQRYVEIRIEDTGSGMSEEQLCNLFKSFWSTKEGGTGLGLVIVKRIIEKHKGKIEITSKEGIGTVVTVLLPVQQQVNNEQNSCKNSHQN